MSLRGKINRVIRWFRINPYPPKSFGKFGKGCKIGDKCVLVPKNMYLDDYVVIQNLVNFISSEGKIKIGKYSVISSACVIIPGTHLASVGIPFYYQAMHHFGDEHFSIEIEEDCWVGASSTLLSKCKLGRGSVVAAGSVVTKEFPPYAVIAGVPAKIIGVKFSKEDILKHERAIYPESERLSEDYIDGLFEKYFKNLKPLKKAQNSEIERFNELKSQIS